MKLLYRILRVRLTFGYDLDDLVSTNGLERKESPESLVQRDVAFDVEQTVGELLQLVGRYLDRHDRWRLYDQSRSVA
jgi:hypothetical protein